MNEPRRIGTHRFVFVRSIAGRIASHRGAAAAPPKKGYELRPLHGLRLRSARTTYHIDESAHSHIPDILGARFIRLDMEVADIAVPTVRYGTHCHRDYPPARTDSPV